MQTIFLSQTLNYEVFSFSVPGVKLLYNEQLYNYTAIIFNRKIQGHVETG